MRSLTELRALAEQHGVAVTEVMTREDIMDALRDRFGSFDPTYEVDPAKAEDLKDDLVWQHWPQNPAAVFSGIAPFLNDEWVLEPKLDGARMRLFIGQSGNTLNTGRRSDVTMKYIDRSDNFPHLRDCAVPEFAGTILDGELMPPVSSLTTESGVTTKGTLNSAVALINVNPRDAVRTQQKYGQAILVVFDVLAVKGERVDHLPWTQRRQMLESLMEVMTQRCPCMQIISVMDATVDNIVTCLNAGFEGAMLKKRDARYQMGKRMKAWRKIKKYSTGDFFIIGSKPGKGRNLGKVGSLKLAYMDDDGKPVYVADARGFSDAMCDAFTDPATGDVKAEWLGKVVEIMGQGRTKGDRIRHPHLVRLRPDKTAEDCRRDQLELFSEV